MGSGGLPQQQQKEPVYSQEAKSECNHLVGILREVCGLQGTWVQSLPSGWACWVQ